MGGGGGKLLKFCLPPHLGSQIDPDAPNVLEATFWDSLKRDFGRESKDQGSPWDVSPGKEGWC